MPSDGPFEVYDHSKAKGVRSIYNRTYAQAEQRAEKELKALKRYRENQKNSMKQTMENWDIMEANR